MFATPIALLPILLLTACSRSPPGPPLVPVEGTITLDDKPLAAADIIFVPQGATMGQGGVGRTDASGKFALTALPDRKDAGAPAGSYRVVINKLVKPDGTDYVPDPNAGPFDTGGFRELLPPAYSDMAETRLEAEVPAEGTKNLDFKLSSKK